MTKPDPDLTAVASDLVISAESAREMLATLQEAVVTADPEARRVLLKGVIARLQEALTQGLET